MDDLLAHDAIGWDVDGTLIGHPASRRMMDWIRRHPGKMHMVVTFRAGDLLGRLGRDMDAEHPGWRPLFSGVLSGPEAGAAGGLILPGSPEMDDFLDWKGRLCGKAGIGALVDDDTANVAPGCGRHGILLVHPDRFGVHA